MSLRSYFLISALAVGLSACGAERPGPLKHHFDDMYIATVPIDDKRSVLDAQQDWSIAKMELANVRQQYGAINTDVKISQNEAKKYKLEKDSVKARKKDAEKAGDMNTLNETNLLLQAADLNYQAAKKKVAYLEAHRNYMKLNIEYHEDKMYEAEARYEMSKASMATSHNIQPPGFVPANFHKQQEFRTRYAQQTRARVEKARLKAERIKKEWNGLERAAQDAENSAYGTPAPPPPAQNDPFAPAAPAPTSAPPPAPAPRGGQTPFEPIPPMTGGTR